MFIYYFVHVARPMDEVVQAITGPTGELNVWARLAYETGEELRIRLRPGAGTPAKSVEVVLGKPRSHAGTVYLPIVWKATGAELLFPLLEADLAVATLGANLTQISLRGSYKPPLGPVGDLLDRALLHHLAEGCVKNFMDRVQGALDPVNPNLVA